MIRIALDWALRLLKKENSPERVKYLTINTSVCKPLLDCFLQNQNMKGYQSPALRVKLEIEDKVQFSHFLFSSVLLSKVQSFKNVYHVP